MKKGIIAIITVIIIAVLVCVLMFIFPSEPEPQVPPPEIECYDSFEEMAQAIKDDSFSEKNYINEDIKEIMKNTNIIKLKVGDQDFKNYEDDEDGDGDKEVEDVVLYCPSSYGYPRGYYAKLGYEDYDEFIMLDIRYIQIKYHEGDYSGEMFPEEEGANYNAVINGQSVHAKYSKNDGRHCCRFVYKDMYTISLKTDNKELLDVVMSNLTVEEISVK